MSQPISYREIFFGTKAAAAWTITTATAISGANFALMLTIAPTVTREFGTVDLISWLTTLYLVPAIISGIVTGALARQLGMRRLMYWTAMVLAAGFGLAIVAPTFEWLLFARFLQGVGAGWGAAISFLLIREHFTGDDTARGFVVEAIVYAVGAAGGPLLAGWLLEVATWRAVFVVDLLVTAIFFVLILRLDTDATDARPTSAGQRLTKENGWTVGYVCAAVVLLVAAGTDQPPLLGTLLFVAAIFLTIVAVRGDRRSQSPIFPLELVSLRSAAGIGMIVTFILGAVTTPISIFVPLLAEELLGLRPALAGIIATVLALAWSFSALSASSITRQRSIDAAMIGMPICHLSGAILFIVSVYFTNGWLMAFSLILMGTGFGLCWAFLLDRTIKTTGHGQGDLSAALLPSIFTLGEVVGSLQAALFARFTGLDNDPDQGTLVAIGNIAGQNLVVLALISLVLVITLNRKTRRAGSELA